MEQKRFRGDEEEGDLDTFSSSSSSSSEFGSFIVHTTFPPSVSTRSRQYLIEHALLLLTSESDDDDHPEKNIFRSRSVRTDCLSSTTTGDNDDDDDAQLVLKVQNLGFPLPLKFNMHDKQVVGSCNGLVCLQDRRMSRFKPHEVYLWNPATGQFRILPQCLTSEYHRTHRTLAVFGFDFKTKDYKVVLFTGLYPKWNGKGPQDCFCRVQVYSLTTDSWRLLEGIPCLPGFPYLYRENVVYNRGGGTCLFLARFFWTEHEPCLPQNDRFIISFDLTKEIITPIELPDHDRNQELCLCSWGDDKLALFTSPKIFPYTPPTRTHEDFNIWVLNYDELYGGAKILHWTKLASFRLELAPRPDESYKPRGITNDGKYVLLESLTGIGSSRLRKKMNLYNLATKEVKSSFLTCQDLMSKAAYPYKPSRVSVMSSSSNNL